VALSRRPPGIVAGLAASAARPSPDALGTRKYPHAVQSPDRRSLRARVDADERRRWLLRCKVDQKTVAASWLAFAAWILAVVKDARTKEVESWEQSPTLCG
jgi:hypothetical protein